MSSTTPWNFSHMTKIIFLSSLFRLYGWEVQYHVFLMCYFGVIPQMQAHIDMWIEPSSRGNSKNREGIFSYWMPTWVRTIRKSAGWILGQNILYDFQVCPCQQFSLWNFYESHHPQSCRTKSRHFLRFTLWLRSSTCTLINCQICMTESCTTMILSGGKKILT